MIPAKEKAETEFLIQKTLDKLDHSDCKINLFWNKRFTSRLGDALYQKKIPGHSFEYARIRLSEPLWPKISKVEKDETVVHEVCHIVSMREAARAGRYIQKHGKEWKTLMRICGKDGKVTHSVDTSEFKRTYKTRRVACFCKIWPVTKGTYGKIVLGTKRYVCKACKYPLKALNKNQIKALDSIG